VPENILIINCRSAEVRYLPMYEIFLAGELMRISNMNVKIITVFASEDPRFLLHHIQHEEDLIIFWEYFTTKAFSYLHKYFEVANFLKTRVKNTLLFGGFWPTTHGRYFDEFAVFDHLFEGYSVEKVVEAIKKLGSGLAKFIDVRGAVDWNKYDLNLDYLNDKNNYFYKNVLPGYLSSFSCPRNCKFCVANSVRNDGSLFSARSAEKVQKDVELIVEQFPTVEQIVIKDLNFFYDKKRAFQILDYIKSKELRASVNVDVTIYDINEKFLEKLSVLGVVSDLYFGLESFKSETRRRVGKPFGIERLEKTFELVDHYNINLTGNVILGLPWQDKEEVDDSISKALFYMRKYQNVFIAMNVYKPEYGSDLQREYFADLHERLSFRELIELYKNNVSQFQERVYGREFSYIDLERVHNCIRMVMRSKRAKNFSRSKVGKVILEFIRTSYEKQLKPPYFGSKILSLTLERRKVDWLVRYILPLFRYQIGMIVMKDPTKIFDFFKGRHSKSDKEDFQRTLRNH
jgi:radical SAM superfamily enzyme YgiQ (UPF0313 family)